MDIGDVSGVLLAGCDAWLTGVPAGWVLAAGGFGLPPCALYGWPPAVFIATVAGLP